MQRYGFVFAAILALAATAGAQTYDPDVDPLEQKCVQATSKAQTKLIGARMKCLAKCWAGARKGSNPASDCTPPYAGATATCLRDPVKGAAAKNVAAIVKKCDEATYPGKAGCPECYGGDCSAGGYAGARTASAEAQLDDLAELIWCEPLHADPGRHKCQDTVAKEVTKLFGCRSKCIDKCYKNVAAGKVPVGACDGPFPTDPATVGCIADGEKGCLQKAAYAIRRVCVTIQKNPQCYLPDFEEGGDWSFLVNGLAGANDAQTYCGSPSGAFVDG